MSSIWSIEPLGFRAEAARAAGADEAAGCYSAVAELTEGRGADLVIEVRFLTKF